MAEPVDNHAGIDPEAVVLADDQPAVANAEELPQGEQSKVEEDSGEGEVEAGSQELHTIVVDGQELQVPYDELVKGYSRQADYTKKTQQIAAEREELASLRALREAFDRDPKATLEALRQAYEIDSVPVEEEDLDPTEAKIRELEAKYEAREAQARQEAIVKEATAAAQKYEIDGDAEALLGFAIENNIGSLEVAAEILKVRQDRAKAAEAESRKTQATQRKRSASVIEGGSPRNTSTTAPQPKSVQEAWELAKKQAAAMG